MGSWFMGGVMMPLSAGVAICAKAGPKSTPAATAADAKDAAMRFIVFSIGELRFRAGLPARGKTHVKRVIGTGVKHRSIGIAPSIGPDCVVGGTNENKKMAGTVPAIIIKVSRHHTQGETVPLARPPGTRQEQPFPRNDARVSSHVLAGVVQ
jgi:hypothetical protein